MVDEGLVQYIRERLGEGYKEGEIRAALQGHGHPDAAIDEAFNRIHRSSKGSPITIFLILIILVMVGTIAFLLLKPDAEPGPDPVIDDDPVVIDPPTDDVVSIAADLKLLRLNLTPDELYYETVDTAVTKSKNTGDGILICSINKDPLYKNWCLTELADQRVDPSYCTVISEAKQRDECYLAIIMHGEDQYCSKLVLEEHKRVCDLLLGEV